MTEPRPPTLAYLASRDARASVSVSRGDGGPASLTSVTPIGTVSIGPLRARATWSTTASAASIAATEARLEERRRVPVAPRALARAAVRTPGRTLAALRVRPLRTEFYAGMLKRAGSGRGPTWPRRAYLDRLDEAIDGHPRELYLLVGTNDIGEKIPAGQVERNYRAILARVAAASPSTRVVVLGVLPVNRGYPNAPNYDNGAIVALNRRIKALVAEFASYRYIDLGAELADPAGNLRMDLTDDGLHLNVDGYLAVRDALGRLDLPALGATPSRGEAAP